MTDIEKENRQDTCLLVGTDTQQNIPNQRPNQFPIALYRYLDVKNIIFGIMEQSRHRKKVCFNNRYHNTIIQGKDVSPITT